MNASKLPCTLLAVLVLVSACIQTSSPQTTPSAPPPTPISPTLPTSTAPTLATRPSPPPAASPSPPPLPDGYEIRTDTFVHLEFALPLGWTRLSGTAPGAVYAEYGPPTPGTYPTFRAGADSNPGQSPSPDQVLSGIIAASASEAGDSLDISDQYDVTIAGQRGAGVEFSLTRNPSDAFFSIMAVALGPDGRGYILQWTSRKADESQARQLFQDMLPFFRFLE